MFHLPARVHRRAPRASVPHRARRLAAGLTAGALLAAAPLLALPAASAVAATAPGAAVPFTEYLAANAATNGNVLAPDYTYGTLASEATGRQAVQLVGQGKYVSFTLTAPANAVDFHYAIPDSLDGAGLTAPISVYVNGTKTEDLQLTSKNSWLYGAYTFTSNPADVGDPQSAVPHDFYDDVRTMFPSVLPIGTVVKLQVDANDTAPWYAINTADFENVPAPLPKPAGYLDVTQAPYNIDSTGVADATTKLQQAINDASAAGTGVYLPQGLYNITAPIGLNKVGVAGAGEWYTELTGHNVEFQGNVGQTTGVTVHDLSIFGNVNTRDDSDGSVNGFNGGFNNTTISNVWIQNAKVGAWIVGATTNLKLQNMRIQDTLADGINFDGGVTNSSVSNSFLRNTQDDGLALWSSTNDSGDVFDHNTVDSPGLANNIAFYGGSDNSATNNLLQDTVTRGGGIHVGNRFGAVALAGTTTISGNKLVRTGQFDPGWDYGVGAMWFFALDSAMTGTVNVTGNEIDDSPYEAFQFEGTLEGGKPISGINISNDTVNNVGTYVFQDQTSGSASVSGVTATGVGVGGVEDCGSGFALNTGSGNTGWSTAASCGFPANAPVTSFPSTVTFENATVGHATPVQKVTVYNTGRSATPLGGISATGGFTVTQDAAKPCGSSLAGANDTDPGMWCQVDVSYTAPASGITTGTLTVPNSQSGGPRTVQLIGSDGGTTVNTPVSASPGSLAFGSIAVGSTTAAKTVTVSNPGPAAATLTSITASGPFAQTNTCGSTLAAGASCTVSVTFTPTTGGAQSGTLAVANSTTTTPVGTTLSGTGVSSTTNLAAGATITASSSTGGFPASNTNDGSTSSYWESNSSAFPQWLQADLGSAQQVGSLTLDLPPATAWAARTETLSVLGSTDGSTWTTLKASAGYTFDPATGNTTTISLPTGSVRYLRLNVTGNTGWPAAQFSELQIFPGGGSTGGGGGSTAPALAATPASLTFAGQTVGSSGAAQTTTVKNNGTAAASLGAVTVSGDYTDTTSCGSTLAVGASCTVSVTFKPTATGTRGGTVSISSNDPAGPLTVALTGTGNAAGGGGGGNLALTAVMTASGSTQNYTPANTNDGSTSSYWESTDNAFPQWLQADLGSAKNVTTLTLDLPPATAWAARTETLSVLGSTDGSSWTTLKASAGYTFDPATGNTVTITVPTASVRYLRLNVTGNTGWPAAQLSEVQIFS
ncbi:discoidin domain-containing protein [Streptacidiphilus sp. N1-12]|uniref:Discoidin domain-containing protein n=2 Tax=Streptacidiphilus alkalitolerans TaxID=3342712 RepID=A0ABV6W867_9ACTN